MLQNTKLEKVVPANRGREMASHNLSASPPAEHEAAATLSTHTLGVLCCFALPYCLFDLACFFLPSFSSLINMHTAFGVSVCVYMCMCRACAYLRLFSHYRHAAHADVSRHHSIHANGESLLHHNYPHLMQCVCLSCSRSNASVQHDQCCSLTRHSTLNFL